MSSISISKKIKKKCKKRKTCKKSNKIKNVLSRQLLVLYTCYAYIETSSWLMSLCKHNKYEVLIAGAKVHFFLFCCSFLHVFLFLCFFIFAISSFCLLIAGLGGGFVHFSRFTLCCVFTLFCTFWPFVFSLYFAFL